MCPYLKPVLQQRQSEVRETHMWVWYLLEKCKMTFFSCAVGTSEHFSVRRFREGSKLWSNYVGVLSTVNTVLEENLWVDGVKYSVVWSGKKYENENVWLQHAHVYVCLVCCLCVTSSMRWRQCVYTFLHKSIWVYVHVCVYTAKSVFLLDEEVTGTLCPVSSVHTSHTPSGSRGPFSVWTGADPWLIYFLPGTTAEQGGQRLQGLPEGGEKARINWDFCLIYKT